MSKTIIRVAHDRENPYMLLARKTARNPELSYEALGLLTYLLSQPDDWQVIVSFLERPSAGREKLHRILKELKTSGYLTVEQTRGPQGQIGANQYIVREIALTPADSPLTANPSTVEPLTVNPPLLSTSSLLSSKKRLSKDSRGLVLSESLESVDNKPKDTLSSSLRSEESVAVPQKSLKKTGDASKPRRKHHNEDLHHALVRAFGFEPDEITRSVDGLYWSVAAELQAIGMTAEQIPDLKRFIEQLARHGEWRSYTVKVLATYAPDFLRRRSTPSEAERQLEEARAEATSREEFMKTHTPEYVAEMKARVQALMQSTADALVPKMHDSKSINDASIRDLNERIARRDSTGHTP